MKKNRPKVSVVIPVYNSAKYLQKALESVMNQTLRDLEIIVVDDGSTDASPDIIQRYASLDSRIRVVTQPNSGVGVAINKGIELATGEYWAEMDSDDYIKPEMYEELYDCASRHDLDVCISNYNEFVGEDETFKLIPYRFFEDDDEEFYNTVLDPADFVKDKSSDKYLRGFAWCLIWTALYKHKFLMDNKIRWNEDVRAYNDHGFWIQTRVLAKRIMYVDKAYYYYRRDNSGSTINNFTKFELNFFDEQKFIRNFLEKCQLFDSHSDFYFKRIFCDYLYFALPKLPFDKIDEFALKISPLVRDFLANHQVAKNIFNRYEWDILHKLINDPYGFITYWKQEHYKVSVIMPVYNGAKRLQRALDGVVNQSLRGIEIIVIDDASTDGTAAILAKYANSDSRIRIITNQEQRGAGAARNAGMRAAHGTYLSFLDADDIFHKDMLTNAYGHAVFHKADVVIFGCKEFDCEKKIDKPLSLACDLKLMPKHRPFSGKEFVGNPFNAFGGWAWDKLFNREYVMNSGYRFNEDVRVGEDGCFTYPAVLNAERIMIDENIYVTYNTNTGDNASANYNLLWRENIEYYRQLKALAETDSTGRNTYYLANYFLANLFWLVRKKITSAEQKAHIFDYLLEEGFDFFGVLDLLRENRFEHYNDENIAVVKSMLDFKPGEYADFVSIAANADLSGEKPEDPPKYRGKILFNDTGRFISPEKGVSFVKIKLLKKPFASNFIVIDFLFLADQAKPVVNTLYLTTSSYPVENGEYSYQIDQFEWEKAENVFCDNIGVYIKKAALYLFSRFVAKYTGFSFNVRFVESRDLETPRLTMQNLGWNDVFYELPSDICFSRDCLHGEPTEENVTGDANSA